MSRPHSYIMDAGHSILVIGKTGNGKSSLCNAILGREHFKTGTSMAGITATVQHEVVTIKDKSFMVVDTPDVVNADMTKSEQRQEVDRWRHVTKAKPSLVLLAVRCDVRYTAEEYAIYKKILKLWGDAKSLRRRLVVAFTFGDRQDRDLEEEVKTVCPELKKVLRHATDEHVIFNKNDGNGSRQLVDSLVTTLNRLE